MSITLSFKAGDSSVNPTRGCTQWSGSETKTYIARENSVITGISISPYFYDSSLIPVDRNICTNNIFGNINNIFFRDINNPSIVTSDDTLIGQPVNDITRANTLSIGDVGSANNMFRNIFSPNLNGGKFYALSSIQNQNFSENVSIPCVNSNCQTQSITSVFRNIYNPRDTIRQFSRIFASRDQTTSINSFPHSNPADFFTQLTWNYSPTTATDSLGIGNVIDAKGKTIEIGGLTIDNITSIVKDPLASIIYDQNCMNWSMTQFVDAGRGFIKTVQKIDVKLIEKIRPTATVLYSDYFEEPDKKVRYFEAVNQATNKVLAELYATIDVSGSVPKIRMWSSWREGIPFSPSSILSDAKLLFTGWTGEGVEVNGLEVLSNFTPDMPLRWGVIPDTDMLISQYNTNLQGNIGGDLLNELREEFGFNFFILCGEVKDSVLDFGSSKRTLNVFSPNGCENLSICSNSEDCSPFGLNVCLNGRCLECTTSEVCGTNRECVDNKCLPKKCVKSILLFVIIAVLLLLVYLFFKKR